MKCRVKQFLNRLLAFFFPGHCVSLTGKRLTSSIYLLRGMVQRVRLSRMRKIPRRNSSRNFIYIENASITILTKHRGLF